MIVWILLRHFDVCCPLAFFNETLDDEGGDVDLLLKSTISSLDCFEISVGLESMLLWSTFLCLSFLPSLLICSHRMLPLGDVDYLVSIPSSIDCITCNDEEL